MQLIFHASQLYSGILIPLLHGRRNKVYETLKHERSALSSPNEGKPWKGRKIFKLQLAEIAQTRSAYSVNIINH